MASIGALAGRVVLRFPPPAKESKGGILIPETSQLRPEFGEIFDIGTPLNEEQRVIATELFEMKKQGIKIPISYGSGVGYWRDYDRQAGLDEKEWGWLKEYRVYRIGELAGFLWEDVN